jgi:predicted permease
MALREVALSRLTRAIVRTLAPGDEAAQILEDLAEEAEAIAAREGRIAARRWQHWQVAHSIRPWISRRLRKTVQQTTAAVRIVMTSHWGLISDIRISARRLAKSPGFTALAVTTLAIGIGAVSTVFSFAYALWLKPLPYRDPAALVWVQARHEPTRSTASLTSLELGEYQRGGGALSAIAGFSYGAGIARVGGEPLRIVAYRVSPNLFRVLGVPPAIGRDFTDDDATSKTPVLMLSHAAWMTRFGGDPAVTSKTMTLFDQPYAIAGVMPPDFAFPRGLEADVWLPKALTGRDGNARVVQAVGRLAPGRTVGDAAVEMDARSKALAAASPDTNRDWTAVVAPAGETASASSQLAFQSLLGLVGLFLAISCANLAGLLLARNASRRAELAVCLSIGAPRWRLARMLLVETMLLAAAGCAAGVALAVYGARMVASFMPPDTPGVNGIEINSAVVLVAVIASAIAAALIALGPALGVRSMKPVEALASSRTSAPAAGRAQRALVTVEISLAVLLVVGAGVMVRSLTGLIGRDRGYDPRGLYALNVSLPFANDSFQSIDRRSQMFDEIIARVTAVPGVHAAGATTGFPGSALGILGGAAIDPGSGRASVMAAIHAASGGYFQAMKIPIKLGRAFSVGDSPSAPGVAIVNEELAAAFPGRNPIGQRIPLAILDSRPKMYEIVGVAGNIRLGDRVAPRVFVPLAQAPPYWIDLVFRADAGDQSLPEVRRALRSMSGDFLLENESSFRTIIVNSLALERTQTAFAVMIGSLATIVTAIGLYALMTFVTTQRRRELGIRLALGSAPRQLFYQAMSGALRLVTIGVVLGTLTTALAVRVVGSRVFGLTSADLTAYAAAAMLVVAVSVAAVWIPARRVMRTDPLIAIRQD